MKKFVRPLISGKEKLLMRNLGLTMISILIALMFAGLAVAETASNDPVKTSKTPKSTKSEKAKGQAGSEITELLQEGKIEVETQGSGIQNVTLRIRRLVGQPVTVIIPVGSFFVSENSGSQNMVGTGEIRRTLKNNAWITITVPAACANRPKDIPGNDDRFAIQRSPQQEDLIRLMPVLKKAKVPFEIRQAAVWIVTDDATYRDLGILARGYSGGSGSRVINETEAAKAMRLCQTAGIDITSKQIWKDRKEIANGLESKKAEFLKWMKTLEQPEKEE